jgi:mRNA interferase HicA
MKRRGLIKYLRENGCELLREGKRHSWWYNPSKDKIVFKKQAFTRMLERSIASDAEENTMKCPVCSNTMVV